MDVFALDPGGTTGWAEWVQGKYRIGHLGPKEHHKELFELLNRKKPDVVVSESFEYRRGQRDHVELVSREYIGIGKLWCRLNDRKMVLQTAASAKTFVTDERLSDCGLLLMPRTIWPNQHMNDAMRHLVFYLIKWKVTPWEELLKCGWKE